MKQYRAMATVKDEESGMVFEVTIYSGYGTEEDAQEGISRFLKQGYSVIKTWIE